VRKGFFGNKKGGGGGGRGVFCFKWRGGGERKGGGGFFFFFFFFYWGVFGGGLGGGGRDLTGGGKSGQKDRGATERKSGSGGGTSNRIEEETGVKRLEHRNGLGEEGMKQAQGNNRVKGMWEEVTGREKRKIRRRGKAVERSEMRKATRELADPLPLSTLLYHSPYSTVFVSHCPGRPCRERTARHPQLERSCGYQGKAVSAICDGTRSEGARGRWPRSRSNEAGSSRRARSRRGVERSSVGEPREIASGDWKAGLAVSRTSSSEGSTDSGRAAQLAGGRTIRREVAEGTLEVYT